MRQKFNAVVAGLCLTVAAVNAVERDWLSAGLLLVIGILNIMAAGVHD